MTPFFRRIRQKLANDNQFLKYSRYAIGEIVLVVVGILIALSINSWNQKRLNQQEEKEILINLKGDFQNSIEELIFLNSLRTNLILAGKEITLIDVDEIEQYSESYLDSLFGWTMYVPTFNNKAGSLSVLLNTGKINLISNTDLRNQLIEWPGDVADMIEDEVSHSNLYYNDYLDILTDYITVNNLTQSNVNNWVRFNKPTFAKMPDNKYIKSQYESILRHKKFLNILHLRVRVSSGSNQETSYLIDKAKAIIQRIDEEIDEP